jgi:hypothetical protein
MADRDFDIFRAGWNASSNFAGQIRPEVERWT